MTPSEIGLDGPGTPGTPVAVGTVPVRMEVGMAETISSIWLIAGAISVGTGRSLASMKDVTAVVVVTTSITSMLVGSVAGAEVIVAATEVVAGADVIATTEEDVGAGAGTALPEPLLKIAGPGTM